MKNQNISQIKSTLQNLQIEALAFRTKFSLRRAQKITATSFLISFFNLMISGNYSLRLWASQLSALNGVTVSFQALAKKLDFRHAPFFHELFHRVLTSSIHKGLNFEVRKLFKHFNRVIVEDSTCFKLPQALIEFFPGARLPHGRKATARLHLRIYLKRNTYGAIAIRNYCQNDQTYAADVLKCLKKGDLLIRDLGYWVIDVFRSICNRKAYFLSRLNIGTHVLNPVTQQVIDLVHLLKKKDGQGITQIDIPVLLGKDHLLPLRLVGVKLNEVNTTKRRKMLKKNRHKDINISPKAWYLMSWNLFITNVPSEVWSTHSIYNAYNLRWHIEMIFKCWKSKFKFREFFKYCHGRNPVKPEIILLLLLTWFALFYVPMFNSYANQIMKRFHLILSPFRFADFLRTHFYLFASPNKYKVLKLLSYYACYDKRYDRLNHFEKLYMNFLS